MTTIELEQAVEQLAPPELEKFTEWFEHFIASQWDTRFEGDATSGRLAHLADKADRDFDTGQCTSL